MRPNVRKYLNVLVVRGTYRKWFLSRKREFELRFYFTPVKSKVIDYTCEGITLSRLELGQIIGCDVSELENWANTKGYYNSRIIK